jgi:hypothetical protein
MFLYKRIFVFLFKISNYIITGLYREAVTTQSQYRCHYNDLILVLASGLLEARPCRLAWGRSAAP